MPEREGARALHENSYLNEKLFEFPVAAGEKMTTTRRFETTEMNHLPGLETRSLRSRRGRTTEIQVGKGAPSRGSEGRVLPASSRFWGSKHPWACGHIPPICVFVFMWLLLCVCVSPTLSLAKTPAIGFRATLIRDELFSDPSLNQMCQDSMSK